MIKKGLFLDRDGVINEDYGYVYRIKDFKFKDGIFELLKLFKNYEIFIVTNQSGIARGFYTKEDFYKLMDWVKDELKKRGIDIVDVAFCPHHPDFTGVCSCRKPEPKMILDLAKKHQINLSNSIMIGDKESDIEASKRAGIKTNYLVKNSIMDILSNIKKESP